MFRTGYITVLAVAVAIIAMTGWTIASKKPVRHPVVRKPVKPYAMLIREDSAWFDCTKNDCNNFQGCILNKNDATIEAISRDQLQELVQAFKKDYEVSYLVNGKSLIQQCEEMGNLWRNNGQKISHVLKRRNPTSSLDFWELLDKYEKIFAVNDYKWTTLFDNDKNDAESFNDYYNYEDNNMYSNSQDKCVTTDRFAKDIKCINPSDFQKLKNFKNSHDLNAENICEQFYESNLKGVRNLKKSASAKMCLN